MDAGGRASYRSTVHAGLVDDILLKILCICLPTNVLDNATKDCVADVGIDRRGKWSIHWRSPADVIEEH